MRWISARVHYSVHARNDIPHAQLYRQAGKLEKIQLPR